MIKTHPKTAITSNVSFCFVYLIGTLYIPLFILCIWIIMTYFKILSWSYHLIVFVWNSFFRITSFFCVFCRHTASAPITSPHGVTGIDCLCWVDFEFVPALRSSYLGTSSSSRHLGSFTAANWVSFDFNVSYSSCWGYSLMNTLKLKKTLCKKKKAVTKIPAAGQLRNMFAMMRQFVELESYHYGSLDLAAKGCDCLSFH